jgi:hypothetical protein
MPWLDVGQAVVAGLAMLARTSRVFPTFRDVTSRRIKAESRQDDLATALPSRMADSS